ncbi:MAG: hypothetical protein NC402_01955 [Prevotella sp.]|nr:hypothetical protein [Prevotella sp.]MCM1074287.1 hypothetical protein [Ruminococcus sp.]
MKKILTIVVLAIAAFAIAPAASAYSPEMKEFADLLNGQVAGEDGITVTYDGNNLIMNLPASYFDADEMAIFNDIDDLQSLAPIMTQTLSESMGSENVGYLAQLLALYDTNLVLRLHIGKTPKDIVLTPSALMGTN